MTHSTDIDVCGARDTETNEANDITLDRRAFLSAAGAALAVIACDGEGASNPSLGEAEQAVCASWPPTDGSVALLQAPKNRNPDGSWPASAFPDSVLDGGGPQGYLIPAGATVTLTCATPDVVEVGCLIVEGTLKFDPNTSATLVSWGNIIVRGSQGKIEMQPANASVKHTIQFKNIDESKVVGGQPAMPLDPQDFKVRNDVGLWVTDAGKLVVGGANVPQRKGWVRSTTLTSTATRWENGDSICIAPVAEGDFGNKPNGASWSLTTWNGSAPPVVPTVNAGWTVFTAEAFNITRNVNIQGQPDDASGKSHRAHVMFFMSTVPQTITQVTLRDMGPKGVTGTKPLGRYALHFHRCGDGTNGSLVEGVVAVSVGNKGFVPHASNGIIFRDCVAFSLLDIAYWWDPATGAGDYSNGSHAITFEHCAAFAVWSGGAGFYLEDDTSQYGSSNRCTDCVAVGIATGANSGGFWWPGESARSRWTVQDCVAHNNMAYGAYNWWNTTSGPVPSMQNFTAYRNGSAGLFHGAYSNFFQYTGVTCYQNGSGIASSACNNAPVSGRTVISGVTIDGGGNHVCFVSQAHISNATLPQLIVGTTGSTTFRNALLSGGKRYYVYIDELVNGHTAYGWYDFLRVTVQDTATSAVRDLDPADFVVANTPAGAPSMANGSVFRIEQRDGKSFELKMVQGVAAWAQVANNAITQDPSNPQPPPPPP